MDRCLPEVGVGAAIVGSEGVDSGLDVGNIGGGIKMPLGKQAFDVFNRKGHVGEVLVLIWGCWWGCVTRSSRSKCTFENVMFFLFGRRVFGRRGSRGGV